MQYYSHSPVSHAGRCSDTSIAFGMFNRNGSQPSQHVASFRNPQVGATVVDMQVAGRWKPSQMPAHYAKAELAERGAITRFKDGKR